MLTSRFWNNLHQVHLKVKRLASQLILKSLGTDQLRSPMSESGELRSLMSESGELRSPMSESGELRSPMSESGEP